MKYKISKYRNVSGIGTMYPEFGRSFTWPVYVNTHFAYCVISESIFQEI